MPKYDLEYDRFLAMIPRNSIQRCDDCGAELAEGWANPSLVTHGETSVGSCPNCKGNVRIYFMNPADPEEELP